VSAALRERGILASPGGPTAMRLVTHHHVTMADADAVVAAFRDVFTGDVREPAAAATSGTPY
jgi:threonine aldolase